MESWGKELLGEVEVESMDGSIALFGCKREMQYDDDHHHKNYGELT